MTSSENSRQENSLWMETQTAAVGFATVSAVGRKSLPRTISGVVIVSRAVAYIRQSVGKQSTARLSESRKQGSIGYGEV